MDYLNFPASLYSAAADAPAGPMPISLFQIALAVAVIFVNGIVSVWLSLGLHWQLGIGTVRAVLQLGVLGYILKPIFEKDYWWLVLLYSCVMVLVGSYEAISRPTHSYPGMFGHVLLAVGVSAGGFLTYGLVVVVHNRPWWEAQYFIPILGMLLGNAITGVSVGLATVLEDLSNGKDRIELLLSLGSSRWEASKDVLQRAVRVAMTPTINQMNVVGIVSIPGMMTGQILGGQEPAQAARYQMVIIFLIAATSSLASVGAISLSTFTIVDMRCRLRTDRLKPAPKRKKLSDRIEAAFVATGSWIARGWGRVFRRNGSEEDLAKAAASGSNGEGLRDGLLGRH